MKIKGKVYRTVERQALGYGAETWSLKKTKENKLDIAEMQTLRWDYVELQRSTQDYK